MASRPRIVAFGSAAALVIAGAACAVLVGGLTGEILTIVLISVGLAGALLLGFLEAGLSEQRDREIEEARRRSQRRRILDPRRQGLRQWPRRPR